ncbi:MAG: lysophospholipid acyltransferase family protein [Bacteroidales bacterium]|nr:lysophospholipid acyltransferase family protein [Bacteroidales bacterium]
MAERAWQGKTDGTSWMHNGLVSVMRVVPLRLMYGFVALFVVPFYFLFSNGRRPMFHFFRNRLGYAPMKAFCWTYCNFRRFSQIILDRFSMYAGRKFDFDIDNYHLYQDFAAAEPGFLILSAHVGSYESAGYTLVATKKRYNAIVFSGEAESVMRNRQKMFDETNIRMIPVKEDMSHIFLMNSALDNGESVSIPADRVVEGQRTVTCDFFGSPAEFPLGPFVLAAQRDVAVLTIHVMKEAVKKYHIFIEQIQGQGNTIREKAADIARQYVASIETVLRKYPEQWFNYYEFWND